MSKIFIPPSDKQSQETYSIKQKSYKFHSELRQKHIQNYKAKIRREMQCKQNLNNLLKTLPQQLDDVLKWCKQVMYEFSNSQQYKFPDYKIIELYKLIQKYPCLQTVQLLYFVSHRISILAIHQLFQYDIVGLMHKLIINPEKIVPRVLLSKYEQQQINNMFLEIVRKSMLILATLCEESQKARNFIVMSHKSYLCLQKAHQKLGNSIQKQFILCLYTFTKHQIYYDEQFVRIVKNICLTFCMNFQNLSSQQIILTIKSLTAVVKCKQKWAMDLVQQNCQYDLLDKMLKVLKVCNETAKFELSEQKQPKNRDKLKQIGQIVHFINMFLINYIQVSTNQYFQWQSFFSQWFCQLSINDCCYQNARRDIYFIFNNIICQAEQPQSGYQLLRSMVFQHNCIHIFSKCLEKQINQDVIQQLSYCIHSLFINKDVELLANDIISSELVKSCLQAITRNFYSANCNTKQTLLLGLLNLIERTENKQVRDVYTYQVRCYQGKLQDICLIYKNQNSLLQGTIDKLIIECSQY